MYMLSCDLYAACIKRRPNVKLNFKCIGLSIFTLHPYVQDLT